MHEGFPFRRVKSQDLRAEKLTERVFAGVRRSDAKNCGGSMHERTRHDVFSSGSVKQPSGVWPAPRRGKSPSLACCHRLGSPCSRKESKTAGRSRPTSNRRFASGRRPEWLRPREVSPTRIWESRSRRLSARRLAARAPTGVNSSRCTTTGRFFKPRPTSCPRSTSTSSERCRTRG